MTHDFTATVETHWIAHDADTISSGSLGAGENISTALEYLETYTDFVQWRTRLNLLHRDYRSAVAQWLDAERLRNPLASLADHRWRKETGGYLLASGVRVSTTRESQSMINSTVTALTLGLLVEPIRWKGETDWLELTADGLRSMAGEVAVHVNRCFQAEEFVASLVADDPDLDVREAFDAAYEDLAS
jgi:hypothetical protein